MEHRFIEDRNTERFRFAVILFLQTRIRLETVHLHKVELNRHSPFYNIPGGEIPLKYGHYTFRYSKTEDDRYHFQTSM